MDGFLLLFDLCLSDYGVVLNERGDDAEKTFDALVDYILATPDMNQSKPVLFTAAVVGGRIPGDVALGILPPNAYEPADAAQSLADYKTLIPYHNTELDPRLWLTPTHPNDRPNRDPVLAIMMLLAWAAHTRRHVTLLREFPDLTGDELKAFGLRIYHAWHPLVEAKFQGGSIMARAIAQQAVDDRLNSVVEPIRFIKTTSTTSPLVWLATLKHKGSYLVDANADRYEVVVKAMHYIASEAQLVATMDEAVAGMGDDDADDNSAGERDLSVDEMHQVMFTNDVMHGLFHRDHIMHDPLVLTPHFAIALDAFLAPTVVMQSKKFVSVSSSAAVATMTMYQITERGDVSLREYFEERTTGGFPYYDYQFLGFIWQAATALLLAARAYHWHHGDAHTTNGMIRRVPDDSLYYNRPWVYALPSLDSPMGEPRLYVLDATDHRNCLFEWIDFGYSTVAVHDDPVLELDDAALRYDLMTLFNGGHPFGGAFINPMKMRGQSLPPVRWVEFHLANPLIIARGGMLTACRDLMTSSDNLDADLPDLLMGGAALVQMADVETLMLRYPDAVLVSALLHPAGSSAEGDASLPDEDTTPQATRGPKRARDVDTKAPDRKRQRLQCIICRQSQCTRRFCAALTTGRLAAAPAGSHLRSYVNKHV
jgi:hypothetical protein